MYSKSFLLAVIIAVTVLAFRVSAQDEAPTAPADAAAEAPAETGADADGDSADAPEDDVEFVVSEEIPAETELVFPVDI